MHHIAANIRCHAIWSLDTNRVANNGTIVILSLFHLYKGEANPYLGFKPFIP